MITIFITVPDKKLISKAAAIQHGSRRSSRREWCHGRRRGAPALETTSVHRVFAQAEEDRIEVGDEARSRGRCQDVTKSMKAQAIQTPELQRSRPSAGTGLTALSMPPYLSEYCVSV
ncbi:unnamed protein product [Calypogeia fissa]